MYRELKLILVVSCAVFFVVVRAGNAEDSVLADELEKLAEEKGPLLVDNYVPVTMQILQHCIEMIQYEPVMSGSAVENGAKPTTTTRRPMTTTSKPTVASPTTVSVSDDSEVTTAKPADATLYPTSPHKPGYYGPEKPPPTSVHMTIEKTTTTGMATSTTTTEWPKLDTEPTTENLLWSDKPFAEWFLQTKRKHMQQNSLLNVQFLDPLPLKLLQDFNEEPYEPLALRPEDNVNEFRRLYDDYYPGPVSIVVLEKGSKKGGKKKIPPTKPYLNMLMMYDLLKREAKQAMYNVYEGYSEAILNELYQMNFSTAKDQLHFALTRMLERKDVEKSDVVSRSKQMIADLNSKNSAIAVVLKVVPPLRFGL